MSTYSIKNFQAMLGYLSRR